MSDPCWLCEKAPCLPNAPYCQACHDHYIPRFKAEHEAAMRDDPEYRAAVGALEHVTDPAPASPAGTKR